MPNGRPTIYSDELAALICENIADGKSLKEICAKKDMPARSSVYLWLRDNAGFSDMYVRAKEECADLLAEEILTIADQYDTTKDIADHDTVQRAKLRIDARKWIAAKLKPKAYGDRVHTEVTGKDGGPIKSEVTRIEIVAASDNGES